MSTRVARLVVVFAALLAGAACVGRVLCDRPVQPVYAASKADRDAGQALFHEKGCEYCHGVSGVGGEKGPDLSGVGRRLKPEQIRKQISEGGGGMPAFADSLTLEELDQMVAWLKTRRQKAPRHRKTRPEAATPNESGPAKKDNEDSAVDRRSLTEAAGLAAA